MQILYTLFFCHTYRFMVDRLSFVIIYIISSDFGTFIKLSRIILHVIWIIFIIHCISYLEQGLDHSSTPFWDCFKATRRKAPTRKSKQVITSLLRIQTIMVFTLVSSANRQTLTKLQIKYRNKSIWHCLYTALKNEWSYLWRWIIFL